MYTQTVVQAKEPVRNDAVYDFLQMATGVALVLFMWMHMILVASVNLDFGGGRVMNFIAYFFEATYMAQIGGPAIFLVILLHFLMAARKFPFRAEEQKAMWTHTKRFNHMDTWLWTVQAATAFIILVLASIHIYAVLTTLPITAAKSAARIQTGWWLLLYLLLLPCIEFHVGIGIYRIGVKWGWIKRANREYFHGLENKLSLVMIGIGLITLIMFYFIVTPEQTFMLNPDIPHK